MKRPYQRTLYQVVLDPRDALFILDHFGEELIFPQHTGRDCLYFKSEEAAKKAVKILKQQDDSPKIL